MRSILLTIIFLVFGGAIIYTSVLVSHMTLSAAPLFIPPYVHLQDTIYDPQQDTVPKITDVRGKKTLFIGDSHTAADYGWQVQLANQTGMKYNNKAIVGITTLRMIDIAQQNITSYYDYCFIWGGANDMAGNRSADISVNNIQKIVDRCVDYGVTPVVVVGFDAAKCITSTAPKYAGYAKRYGAFQSQLTRQLKNCIVVDTRDAIEVKDCADGICHMKPVGHKKIATNIIEKLRLKRL